MVFTVIQQGRVSMRALFHGLTTLVFGLATCLTASAQTGNQDQNQGQTPGQSQTRSQDQNTTNRNDNNQNNQGERKVIHGIVAGVTVEGEIAIDYRTNRAATAEMTYLTIVGSERDRGRNRDQNDRDQARNRDQNDRSDRDQARNRDQNDRSDRDQVSNRDQNDRNQASNRDQNDRERNNQNINERQASSENQRHNIYLVSLTPRTEVRRASDRGNNRDRNDRNANRSQRNDDNANRAARDRDENNNQANQNDNAEQSRRALTIEALEVGDRVEVRFVQRSTTGDNSNQNMASRKHGRHRTYYGEAVAITILSEPGQNDRDRDSGRDQGRDRNQNNRNDQDNNRDQNP